MTIATLQRASIAPVLHHLRPLTTYSSPSRTIVVAMLVASLLATLGLGHAEAGADLALEQRHEPALLLLGRAEHRQHLHVAGVGRGAVERLGRDLDAAAGQLRERRVLEVREARAPALVGQEQVPQPALAGLAP